jgi:hypothetical protein
MPYSYGATGGTIMDNEYTAGLHRECMEFRAYSQKRVEGNPEKYGNILQTTVLLWKTLKKIV